MNYPFAWLLSLLMLLATGCAPNIKSAEHPVARSSVFRDTDQEASTKSAETLFRPSPVSETELALSSPIISRTEVSAISSGRRRYALVIGNSTYSSQRLKNPVNDASDISAALKRLNFDVTLELNARHEKMEAAVRSFGKKLGKGSVGLFYYAGHAVQYEGENYLIPVDALEAVTAPEHLKHKTVNAGYVLGVMENAGNGLNIAVLDACRDNPFQAFSRGLTRGLAKMPDAEGVLLAYSTSPGKTAEDGTGRNSPYTKHLLHFMTEPNLTIEAVFRKVRREVKAETAGTQLPWYSSSMDNEFYFAE